MDGRLRPERRHHEEPVDGSERHGNGAVWKGQQLGQPDRASRFARQPDHEPVDRQRRCRTSATRSRRTSRSRSSRPTRWSMPSRASACATSAAHGRSATSSTAKKTRPAQAVATAKSAGLLLPFAGKRRRRRSVRRAEHELRERRERFVREAPRSQHRLSHRQDRWDGRLDGVVDRPQPPHVDGYKGYDPEVGGTASGASGSAALNAIDDYGFPNTRSVTFQLSSSF